MARMGIVLVVFFVAIQGSAFGQGFLDSVFGASGLGIMGGNQAATQFDNPRYYGANTDPMQQLSQQPQMGYPQGGANYPSQGYPPQGYSPQGYPPQGYGYPQGQSYDPAQPGIYSDWQNQPLATNAPPAPPPYGPQGPQVAPPGPQQAPATRQAPRVQRRGTRSQAPVQPQPQGVSPADPGQYYSGPQTGRFGDELPPGAVRITTSTPEGTSVQLYPPLGQPQQEPAEQASRPQTRQPRPRAASSSAQAAPQAQGGAISGQSGDSQSSIAMPKPVPIPQGQDPRSGWGAAVNR